MWDPLKTVNPKKGVPLWANESSRTPLPWLMPWVGRGVGAEGSGGFEGRLERKHAHFPASPCDLSAFCSVSGLDGVLKVDPCLHDIRDTHTQQILPHATCGVWRWGTRDFSYLPPLHLSCCLHLSHMSCSILSVGRLMPGPLRKWG